MACLEVTWVELVAVLAHGRRLNFTDRVQGVVKLLVARQLRLEGILRRTVLLLCDRHGLVSVDVEVRPAAGRLWLNLVDGVAGGPQLALADVGRLGDYQ